MIRRPVRRGKDADGRFAEPPWSENSPQWQEIDARLPVDQLARQISRMVDRLDPGVLFDCYDGRGSRRVASNSPHAISRPKYGLTTCRC